MVNLKGWYKFERNCKRILETLSTTLLLNKLLFSLRESNALVTGFGVEFVICSNVVVIDYM